MLDCLKKIIKPILHLLPSVDYPVLNSRLLFEIWLTFILDRSLTSMRDLFYKLNNSGVHLHISTFSKACKSRRENYFYRIYYHLVNQLTQKNTVIKQSLLPIDSTVIELTSKLFWTKKHYQVKLLTGINLASNNTVDFLINFGQAHDAKFLEQVSTLIPDKTVGIMDRGFVSWDFIEQMCESKTLFIVRTKNNMKTQFDHDRFRVVCFCSLEDKSEYRLATNVKTMTDAEIAEAYRCRWQIELLWKFLKSYLKLDELITKSQNGVTMQIIMSLISYLLLQLLEIPKIYGEKLIDKLRWLQFILGKHFSFVHLRYDFLPETLFF